MFVSMVVFNYLYVCMLLDLKHIDFWWLNIVYEENMNVIDVMYLGNNLDDFNKVHYYLVFIIDKKHL